MFGKEIILIKNKLKISIILRTYMSFYNKYHLKIN